MKKKIKINKNKLNIRIGIADDFGHFLDGGPIGEYAQLALDAEIDQLFQEEREEDLE